MALQERDRVLRQREEEMIRCVASLVMLCRLPCALS